MVSTPIKEITVTHTLTRRVPSSVGDPTNYHAVVQALLANPAGATIHADGTFYAGSGIIVAVPEYGYTVTLRDVSAWQGWSSDTLADAVRRWVTRVAPAVTGRNLHPRAFGAWVDGDGRYYLDVVDIFSDADEDLAVAAGRRRNQIAVYHAGRGVEIPTGGTGSLA